MNAMARNETRPADSRPTPTAVRSADRVGATTCHSPEHVVGVWVFDHRKSSLAARALVNDMSWQALRLETFVVSHRQNATHVP